MIMAVCLWWTDDTDLSMSPAGKQLFCDITGLVARHKSICTDAINLCAFLDQDLHLALPYTRAGTRCGRTDSNP